MVEVNHSKLTNILNKIDQEEVVQQNAVAASINPRLQAATKATRPVTSTNQNAIDPHGDENYVWVFWPNELSNLRHTFRRFIEAMEYKLRKNSNKNSYEEVDLPELFELLRGEIIELEKAVQEGNSIETLLEASDSANF